jgi:hypothetical protein
MTLRWRQSRPFKRFKPVLQQQWFRFLGDDLEEEWRDVPVEVEQPCLLLRPVEKDQ